MTTRTIHTLAVACLVAALAPAQKQQEAIIVEQREARQQAEREVAEAVRSSKVHKKLAKIAERLADQDLSAEERAEATRQLLGLVEKIEAVAAKSAKVAGEKRDKGDAHDKRERRGVFVVGEDGLPNKLEWIEKKGGDGAVKVYGLRRDSDFPSVLESHADVERLEVVKRKLEKEHAHLRELEHHIQQQHEEIAEQNRHIEQSHRKIVRGRRDLGARARELRERMRSREAHAPEATPRVETHWIEAKRELAEAKAALEEAKRAMKAERAVKAHRAGEEHDVFFEVHREHGNKLRLGGEHGAVFEIGPGGKGFVLRDGDEKIVIGEGATVLRSGKGGTLRMKGGKAGSGGGFTWRIGEVAEVAEPEEVAELEEVAEPVAPEAPEPPAPLKFVAPAPAVDGDLDAELRSMIEQLRGELRELREMVRGIRSELRHGDRGSVRRGTPARAGGRRMSAMRPSGPRRDRAPR